MTFALPNEMHIVFWAMAFTLAQFELVLAIHRHGSLGKVAIAQGITQPALSRSLKELERQLGISLFERHPSGLKATPFCLAVLPYAANAVEEAMRALEEVRILAGESREVLRIGAVSSAAVSFMPNFISRLLASAPGIRVRMAEGVDEVLIHSLQSRDIDIAICGAAQDNEEIARALELGYGDTCGILIGTNNPLLKRAELSPAEVFAQPWAALPRDSALRSQFDRLVQTQGLGPPDVLVETRSIGIMRQLVARYGFVAWGPAPLYVSEGVHSEVIMLDWPRFQLRRSFFAYRLRHATTSVTVQRALAILRQQSREHGDLKPQPI